MSISELYLNSIELNLSELCNLHCKFCPRSSTYKNRNLHMSEHTLHKILSNISCLPKNNYKLLLAGRSEPALNKNYENILKILIEWKKTNTNVYIEVSTNGTKFKKFLNYYLQLDKIHLNVYYNKTDLQYEKIKNTYKKFGNIVVNRKSDTVPIKYLSSRVGEIQNEMTLHEKNVLLESYCNKPFESVYIDWNGNYNLCCEDWRSDLLVLGNIDTEDIFNYYNNNLLLQEYKQTLVKGQRSLTPCNNCNKRCSKSFIEKIKNHATQNINSIS